MKKEKNVSLIVSTMFLLIVLIVVVFIVGVDIV